jgi:next-to-BRCA1 protein 1
MPGAFAEEKPVSAEQQGKNGLTEGGSGVGYVPCRTCNSCIEEYPDERFVTCQNCPDFDLCFGCYLPNRHGHHPGHTFAPASDRTLPTNVRFDTYGMRHSAICDGCDQMIRGVRHKCLNCPDWDYCSSCFKSAKIIHPHHRFVPVYDRLPVTRSVQVKHVGIFCDGPLCQGKPETYIEGVRYKCAVCNDTDFCANCEASPTNRHNRTHPLIMFKTPVRNVSVTTMNEDIKAQRTFRLGDKPAFKSTATETTLAGSSNNSTTQVQTVADLEPTPRPSTRSLGKEKIAIKDLLAEPIKEKMQVKDLLLPMPKEQTKLLSESVKQELPQEKKREVESQKSDAIPTSLNAYFVADDISDGTRVSPSECFVQTWKLRNPGPYAWPVGCSVRYVGGDNMFNIDHSHPFSTNEITNATESNGIKEEIKPGETFSFSVTMKAPAREGTAISYWRLKAPNGMPFGHKLWCHVVVKKAAPTSPDSEILIKETTKDAKVEQKAEDTKVSEDNDKVADSSSSLSSQMIFPTLEKESPVNSVHEASAKSTSAAPADESNKSKVETPAPASSSVETQVASPSSGHKHSEPQAERELFDDAESVEIVDSDSWDEEDGFVTDEEWDVLGASDEE